MLGIGNKPTEPTEFEISLEGCHTAVIKWKKMESEGFPVHKFRVQRRRLSRDSDKRDEKLASDKGFMSSHVKKSDVTKRQNNLEMHSDSETALSSNLKETEFASNESCPSGDLSSETYEKILTPSQRNLLEWEDVYDQSLPGFHDFGLERGQRGYQYRIQAWNAVGKSEWVLFEIKQWGRKKCDTIVSTRRPDAQSSSYMNLFSCFYYVWKFAYSCANIVMGLIGLIVAVLKCKRAMQVSTASKIDPLFPWVLRAVNTLIKAMLGIDIIPHSISALGNNTQATENHPYDISVNSVGLFGYKESSNPRLSQQILPAPSSKKVKTRTTSHISEEDILLESSKVNRNQPAVSFLKLKGTRPVASKNVTLESAPERILQKDQSSVSLCSDMIFHNENTLLNREDNTAIKNDNMYSIEGNVNGADHISNTSLRPSIYPSDSNSAVLEYDDNHCNVCKKRYKFGKRKRHHCSICFGSFCHKHGRTTHNNLVTCKVPGNCVCNLCLEKIK